MGWQRDDTAAENTPRGSASISQQLAGAVSSVRAHGVLAPAVGVVLGSGLGDFADRLADARSIPYRDIPGLAACAVQGHAGRLVVGRHGRLPVAAMQGRVHLYEGHSAEQVVFGVRLLVALGARTIILTNAAGAIRTDLTPGTLMLIEDHLNLTGRNCLLGPNDEALGTRFPALTDAYDPALRGLCAAVAGQLGLELRAGVYAGLLGPSYETPAEIRMLRTLGADAVGMSTVLETIAIRHMGARCLAISCITNAAAGLPGSVLDHRDVQRVAAAASQRFSALLEALLEALSAEEPR